MNRSLSVLLPVHNAQATLAGDVSRMLDLLPELTSRFDVLIIDDGSTDATHEVAEDLSTQFPQVRMMRNSHRLGVDAALRGGLSRTQSHVVVGHTGDVALNVGEIAGLWQRNDPPVAAGQRDTWVHVAGHGSEDAGKWLPKAAIDSLASAPRSSTFRLLRHDPAEQGATKTAQRSKAPAKSGGDRPASIPIRPNFLTKLKDFSFGR